MMAKITPMAMTDRAKSDQALEVTTGSPEAAVESSSPAKVSLKED